MVFDIVRDVFRLPGEVLTVLRTAPNSSAAAAELQQKVLFKLPRTT
jgi:hypothetical protein